MSLIGKLLGPLVRKGLSLITPIVIAQFRKWLLDLYEDWKIKKQIEMDKRAIEDAFKNPNRSEGARQLDDIFRGKK